MEEQNLTKKQRRELKRQQKLNQQMERAKKRKMRSVLIWLVVLFVLGGISWLVFVSGGDNINNSTPRQIVNNRPADAHIKGNPQGIVSIVEFSDFQCPACAYYRSFLSDIIKDLDGDVSVEYRHFPLRAIHANSGLAAQASEAAALQDKFWEMHDILFDRQDKWKNLSPKEARDEFIAYASELGMDKDKFANDLDSDSVKEKVQADERQAQQLGLNSTPSIFVNGLKIKNPRSYADFKKIVESEINWRK